MSWAFEVAARTLWQEVRGEIPEGQAAVAHVIKNRLATGRWGNSLATVCLWPYQFSGWRGPQDPNFTAVCALTDTDLTLCKLRVIMQAALDSKEDPTNGAMWYANLAIVKPKWAAGATITGKFGAHTFFKGVS